MIEVLNNFPKESIEEIVVVAYSTSPLPDLLPNFKGKTRFIRIPCTWLKPFLLRNLNYQVLSFIYTFLFLNKNYHKIGIGTAALHVDTTYVQFIHHQWKEEYLKSQRDSLLRYVYKWVLYNYFCLCENFQYSRKKIKFVSIANFLTKFIQEQWKVEAERVETIYSGINLERFKLPSGNREELFEKLLKKYPVLSVIDPSRPIFLFVGAYERKGLQEALTFLEKEKGTQIIVVGEPENKNHFFFPNTLTVAKISYTSEIPSFYALADCFIFPSKYEPFGLVIIEAVAMGMTVLVNRKNVGASEILDELDDIFFLDELSAPPLDKIRVLSAESKANIRETRLDRLSQYEWANASKSFYPFLEKLVFNEK